MADNIKYRFIQNVGDYFPSGYFNEDFLDKIQKAAGLSADDMDRIAATYKPLKEKYNSYKNFIVSSRPRPKDAIRRTHDFNTELLKLLGYDTDGAYDRFLSLTDNETEVIPVRHILTRNGKTTMLVMEMQNLITVGDVTPGGLFEQRYTDEGGDERTIRHQRYHIGQWSEVFTVPEGLKIAPSVINKAVDAIFLLPQEQRPKYILMLAGNEVLLLDADKWSRGAWLQFSLDELFSQASVPAYRKYYALFHLLASKQTLADDSDTVLMEAIIEDSYKNAYEVTKDLKEGVVLAVETLANEALYYMRREGKPFGKLNPDTGEFYETDDTFEAEVKNDCLSIVYRLLFIFYAESRPELEILPINDEIYNRGYSLEMLRDLEQTRLNSQESRDGYFFDSSINSLFRLLSQGFKEEHRSFGDKSFSVRRIDSPLFDNDGLHHLGDVKIRNSKWQEIIRALSLSKRNGRNGRGRISYANLGVNQLGSVYESLLAYRGFYTEEDYIEVFKPGKQAEGTFLVPYSRIDDFHTDEILYEDEDQLKPLIHPKGTFIYRLNGRDRQKSASYYTPEVLTRSTVKYTLKSIIDEVAEGKREASELLSLKILEPAMGAAAFQNEVVNQIAEAYLTYKQREIGKRIAPDHYLDERQKVKAYIATHNVYGIDLNPTAIELGKLALWLNVMHKDMETPFFAGRLALGNAVIGAWLKTFGRGDVEAVKDTSGKKVKLLANPYWDKASKKVKFFKNRVNRASGEIYHFLLPDPKMLAVTTIKSVKNEHPEELKLMKDVLRQWKSPISADDFNTLLRLSAKIDWLLREHYRQQASIDSLTSGATRVWDGIDRSTSENIFGKNYDYRRKQEIYDTRFVPTSAFYRLKTVMDYWCALWFWPIEDARILPVLSQYWADIEKILDVDDSLVEDTVKIIPVELPASLFPEMDEAIQPTIPGLLTVAEPETEMETPALTREQLLENARTGHGRTLPIDGRRIEVIQRLAGQYHFFHPMLEFIEVFWQRGGFDIIAGNPPWLKLEFEIQNVISDKFPEVLIRDIDATEVMKNSEVYLSDEFTRCLVNKEEIETQTTGMFLNAFVNYPLLTGQQTDLYKCILENSLTLLSDKGYLGLLHPESIYDDPKGQPLRREIYKRLRYHFQYQNALNLFPIAHRRKYGSNIYGPLLRNISFDVINNLFHPNTVDACFAFQGASACGGIKDENGEWNLRGHSDRIIHYAKKELSVLADTFEDGQNQDCPKLVSIHQNQILSILEKLSNYPKHIKDVESIKSVCLDETGAPKAGIISKTVCFPNEDEYEMIFNAPQFYVGNPYYKTPKQISVQKGDFETLDLDDEELENHQRTKYVPSIPLEEYSDMMKGFIIGQEEGKPIYGKWLDYYKVGFRKMINQAGERSLICAVLRSKTAHIHGVISVAFRDGDDTVDMAGLSSSLPMDFYLKTIAVQNLTSSRFDSFPLGVAEKYKSALYSRTLMLNCLTRHYADLWAETWRPEYAEEAWSIDDPRLKPFSRLQADWSHDTPLRNYFERRQALVEIDVIASMALGLSLDDLELMYRIQFPVLQQNEADTWYDANGRIVFTCSKGLTGVGVERPVWERIRAEAERALAEGKPYEYVHTIEKSELYRGQQIAYTAPFTRPDRVENYRRAWTHFSRIFNPENND